MEKIFTKRRIIMILTIIIGATLSSIMPDYYAKAFPNCRIITVYGCRP